jgi:putative ABC transport system permease protein
VTALLLDLRYALRTLVRTPAFTLGVVLTLALGIGANAAMFGVLDLLFLRAPAGVGEAAGIRRVFVRNAFGRGFTGPTTSLPGYRDQAASGAYAEVAAFSTHDLSLGHGAEARQIRAGIVSHTYFPLLRLRPSFGRLFGESDDRAGAAPTAVLGYGFWRRSFGGDSTVLGRQLPIGRSLYTVIGVAPRGYDGLALETTDVWLTYGAATADVMGTAEPLTSRNYFWVQTIARLKPEMTPAAAAATATAVYRRNDYMDGGHDPEGEVVFGALPPALGPNGSGEVPVSAWIGGVAVIVLLIACANVANLLLARAVARRRELAVRAGLGAGRAGLVRLLLAESVVLAAAGGALALVLVAWSGPMVRGLLLPGLPSDTPVVDLRVLAVTAALVALTAALAGVLPALSASRTSVADALRSGTRASPHGGRVRTALAVAQVALTLVLLAGAGLFLRSLGQVEGLDPGFDAAHVLVARVTLDGTGKGTSDANAAYLRTMEHLRSLPGVRAVSASIGLPFGPTISTLFRAEGVDSLPHLEGGAGGRGSWREQFVMPGYFDATGTRVLAGRAITDADRTGSPAVAVVEQAFARRLWPGRDPLGRCLYLDDASRACTQVVGVVQTTRLSPADSTAARMYLPFAQRNHGDLSGLVIRTRGPASESAERLRREIQAFGDLPYASVQSLADMVEGGWRPWRLAASAFTGFGLLALAIAGVGIFAVIAYSVGQRTQEIGIRMALGAEAGRVARSVMAQGLQAGGLGVGAGLLGALVLGRAVASLLFGVRPADPLVLAGSAALLLAVAGLAAWLPARRAARVDPMVALRSE